MILDFLCSSGEDCFYPKLVLRTNRTDECATKRVFGYSKLFFMAVTNLLLSFQGLRLIHFLLQDSTVVSIFTGLVGYCSSTGVNCLTDYNVYVEFMDFVL